MRQTALTVFLFVYVIITIVVLSLLVNKSYFGSSYTPVEVVPNGNLGSPLLKLATDMGPLSVNNVNSTTDKQAVPKETVSTTAVSTTKEEVRSDTVNTRTVDGPNLASTQSSKTPPPVIGSLNNEQAVPHGNSTGFGLPPFVKGTLTADPPRALNNSEVDSTDNDASVKEKVSTKAMSTTAEEVRSDTVTTHVVDAKVTRSQPSGAPLPSVNGVNNQSRGYTLFYSVFEESTNGAKNIWQFQILAKQLGMHVVEPFVIDSTFRMDALAPPFNQSLRFGDYFDIEKWNEMVVRHGGTPLVKWEEFLLNAPREAIVLYTMKSSDLPEPLIIAYDDDLTTKCNVGKGAIRARDINWFKTRFNITKVMCYYCATNKKHSMSIDKFSSYIFGDKKPTEVTIILAGWLGIRQSRVDVGPKSMFSSAFAPSLAFPVSNRIVQAYQSYKTLYIGDHKYVGIVFRTHHVLYFSPLVGSFANQSKYLLQCSKKLSNVLDKVREKWKIFLAYDMGTFGSIAYATGMAKQLAPLRDQIFLDVFNGSLQIEQREEMLIRAAGGITDRGFIAQLEKMISTNADCIILLGPHSGFIRSSAALYMSLRKTKRCIISVCSELVYDSSRHLVSTSTIPDDFIDF